MANEQKLKDEMTEIELATILSSRTSEGMVEFTITQGNTVIKTQWDISKAKVIRNMLLEAIEAAISDTLIFKFMRDVVGMSDEKAAMVVYDFRELRQGTKEAVNPN